MKPKNTKRINIFIVKDNNSEKLNSSVNFTIHHKPFILSWWWWSFNLCNISDLHMQPLKVSSCCFLSTKILIHSEKALWSLIFPYAGQIVDENLKNFKIDIELALSYIICIQNISLILYFVFKSFVRGLKQNAQTANTLYNTNVLALQLICSNKCCAVRLFRFIAY